MGSPRLAERKYSVRKKVEEVASQVPTSTENSSIGSGRFRPGHGLTKWSSGKLINVLVRNRNMGVTNPFRIIEH